MPLPPGYTEQASGAHGGPPPGYSETAPAKSAAAPSLLSDFAKYSPAGFVRGIADALRDPKSAVTGMLKANEQLWEKTKDSYNKGEYGDAAVHFLNYLVPGGSAMEDAGEDFQNGDFAHGLAKTAGIATSMVAGAKAPAILDAAGNVVDRAPQVANAVVAGVKAAAPDVAAGSAKLAAGAAVSKVLPHEAQIALGYPMYQGARQVGRGLSRGVNAFREYGAPAVEGPDELLNGIAQGYNYKDFASAPAEAQQIIRNQANAIRESQVRKQAASQPTPATVTPAPVQEPAPADAPADYRDPHPHRYNIVERPPVAPPAAEPETPPVPESAPHPALTTAMRLEDAADEQAARLQMQAEDIIWANRAHKADRFAAYLLKNKMDPTPENLALAARAMAERGAPSDETVPMIHDRMGYTAPEAETDLEQQLRDSVAQAQIRKTQYSADLKSSGQNGTLSEESQNAAGKETPDQGPEVHRAGQPGEGANPRRAGQGAETIIDVPGEGLEYKGRYVLRELADLNPSHNGITFERNPQYPYENDRDYSNPVNQERVVVNSQADRFKPRYLITDNSDAGNGPPIVEPAGHVLGGNNRTMILNRAYRNPQTAAVYRDMLTAKAAQFGIDPAEIAGMKQPVLTREIDPTANPQQAITNFNKTGTAALTNAERATADARNLNPDVAHYIGGKIEAEGEGATLNDALTGKSGVAIINHLVDSGVFTMQEKPNLIDSRTGAVTAAAKERISKMLTGTMFRDSDQMARIAPEMRNKLERAAPSVLQSAGKPGWDLSQTVRSAVDLIEYATAHGTKNLGDVLAQQGMFGDTPQFTPQAVTMADAIRKLTPTELGKRFKSYMSDSVPSMFGEPTPEEAFKENFAVIQKTPSVGDLKKLGTR
jgi:ddrB-like ParB superfamily domain